MDFPFSSLTIAPAGKQPPPPLSDDYIKSFKLFYRKVSLSIKKYDVHAFKIG